MRVAAFCLFAVAAAFSDGMDGYANVDDDYAYVHVPSSSSSGSSSMGGHQQQQHFYYNDEGTAAANANSIMMRELKKKRDESSFMVPQPMEFHNFPHAEPSVGGYRPQQPYPHYSGSIGVAPYTSVIDTDERLRLTSVMGVVGEEPELMYPANTRMLKKKKGGESFMVPQPMEFHNFPHAQPSVGGYRPQMYSLHGQPAGAVNVAPWTSIIETDEKLRLTSVMGENGQVEIISASPRGMHEQQQQRLVREDVPLGWTRIAPQ